MMIQTSKNKWKNFKKTLRIMEKMVSTELSKHENNQDYKIF
jgi:hypothetical protein